MWYCATLVVWSQEHLIELTAFANANPSQLEMKNSLFLEGAIPTMFAKEPCKTAFAEFGNEIGHFYEQDGSMHLVMHSADTPQSDRSRLGERHPLCANAKKWWVDWHHVHKDRPCVPESLVLVYGPLNAEHKNVVMECIRVAAANCAGVEMAASDSAYCSGSSAFDSGESD